ncbi:winged helix-turn-helix domain-containing protein [Poseidonibacter lekithochrous]|uniref:winged helix-turn-helix domain-containing protein n=1 Tax=Poseidonibacter TaxID=2321187 RepID=UPI001C09329F|nr:MULTISPECIES: winged helix-turn-helix domain-containing protein [Poseidonibacter]MBU3013579.1 winged helix-turn-helix domain-containing protein [Poseidonibacter lekithochrous]MDO6826876.1 winged helix-turn-helix domain-containing protein [Poseidonibacter sp. 1_MG-2023]
MKELKYLNVLYISNGFNQETIIEYLNIKAKDFFLTNDLNEALNILNTKKVNIIFSEYNNLEYFKEVRKKYEKIQIIIISNLIENIQLIEGIKIGLLKFLQAPIKKEELISSLKICIQTYDANKSNIINLQNGYSYDYYNQVLLKNNKIVILSKKENDFFKFMSSKANNTVSYEEINKSIWEGSMTHDALRSLVKELRKKTYKDLIKNISGIGYRFNLN